MGDPLEASRIDFFPELAFAEVLPMKECPRCGNFHQAPEALVCGYCRSGRSQDILPLAMPVDDEYFLKCMGSPQVWPESEFQDLGMLETCPRNLGIVKVVKELCTGQKFAVKCMPLDWARENAREFLKAHPEEWEVPWKDMGITKWLNTQGNKNCVEYKGVYRNTESIMFVMGFAEGGDLFSFLEPRTINPQGPCTHGDDRVRPLIVQFLQAMTNLHRSGVAHRDLSLENVLMSYVPDAGSLMEDVRLFIIDYSMATTQELARGPASGKPSYVAPEARLDASYDVFKADVFACGVIIYAMAVMDYPWLTTSPGGCKCFEYVRRKGFMPYIKSKRKAMVGTVKKPVAEVISPSFAQLLDGMLRISPEERLTLCDERCTAGRSGGSVWDEPWLNAI